MLIFSSDVELAPWGGTPQNGVTGVTRGKKTAEIVVAQLFRLSHQD